MNGKLRNMTTVYLFRGEQVLLLYRRGGKVVDLVWTGSAGGHFEDYELNDATACVLRETEEEREVVPNLMIGFGIDEIQANYVAEIKLRNINKEYILKQTRAIDDLEREIDELKDTLNSSRKLKNVIIKELQAVSDKFAKPRKTEIIYNIDEIQPEEEVEEIPDYPVTVFLSKEGYMKKITAQQAWQVVLCPSVLWVKLHLWT